MKISVIVPVYNVEEFLEQCLESIVTQTYIDLEIILVNDGSTDQSSKICDDFVKRDPRVKLIHQINGGVSSARNIGIKVATGEYITFVDSDDWLEKEMYQKMMYAVKIQNESEVIMCDFINEKYDCQEKITANIRDGFYVKQDIVKELYPTLLVTEDLGRLPIVSACICIFKKELFLNNKIAFDVDLRYVEDYLFMATIMLYTNSFYYLKDYYGYHYRQYEISRSKKYQPKWWDNFLLLNDKLSLLLSQDENYDFSRQIKLQLIHSALFVSSAIFHSNNLKTKEKLILLKKLFNDSVLRSSFSNLDFKNKPLGLQIMLHIVKSRQVLGYWIFKRITH